MCDDTPNTMQLLLSRFITTPLWRRATAIWNRLLVVASTIKQRLSIVAQTAKTASPDVTPHPSISTATEPINAVISVDTNLEDDERIGES